MVTQSNTLMTAEQLLARSCELGRCELIRGELINMSPAGARHGDITTALTLLIGNHALRYKLGKVFSSETGFMLERDPDTVREADVPFVKAQRLSGAMPTGYFEGAPDLAVEVLSPNDRASEVAEKVELWLEKGSDAVWLVDPRRQTVTVYTASHPPMILHQDDTLEGNNLLPGFSVKVADIFA
ncbi:MAG: Uma2 family endonuclease [Phycisphaeraceae bacterium]